MEAKVNMSPPWGQSRTLFAMEDTGLQRVGLLQKGRVWESWTRLSHQNSPSSSGSQEEITGEYLHKAFQQGIVTTRDEEIRSAFLCGAE